MVQFSLFFLKVVNTIVCTHLEIIHHEARKMICIYSYLNSKKCVDEGPVPLSQTVSFFLIL